MSKQRRCPACGNDIGYAATIEQLADLVDKHMDSCLPSRQVVNALREGSLDKLTLAPLPEVPRD